MRTRIIVPGLPLCEFDEATGESRIVGRSLAGVRDTTSGGRKLPVCLEGRVVGEAWGMERIGAGEEECLRFEAEIEMGGGTEALATVGEALRGTLEGAMWTSGIYPLRVNLVKGGSSGGGSDTSRKGGACEA